MTGKISYHRYVRHSERPLYEAKGWRFECDLGPTHGLWSVMMIWTGEGEPPA